jgi:hypothetical protein
MTTNMSQFLIRNALGWGFLLWLAGYVLGFAFYAVVPPASIGWFVMPLGVAITCFVLWKWVRVASLREAVLLGIGWSVIAIVCDYLFIVKLLNPPDGYYKPDVYLYYLSTFALPVAAAWLRHGRDVA